MSKSTRGISVSKVPAGLAAAALLLLLLPAAPLTGQTVTGTMQGTVTDTSGGALPGTGIAIKSRETGQQRNLTTNERGFYSAPFLPIGKYRVEAALQGFGSIVRENVEVTLNSTTVTNFTLDPRVTAEVRVTAEQAHIDTTDQEIKGSLNEKQIMDKPTLAIGSFLSLAEVFAGFNENPTSGQNNPTASSGSSVNFNGTGTRGATFQINGVNNDDSSENQNRQGVALATIKEFQVITNNYSAEFGRGYGSVVLVQTKSGTNDIHADAYEYHQQSSWNDKSFFSRALPKPVNHRDEYGFTAGFPIMPDKLFGFAAFDQTELKGEQGRTRDLFIASDLARPRLTRGNDTAANRAFIDNILARFPANAVPNDARSNRTLTTIININQPDKDYSGRLDWVPGSSNQVSTRYQYTHQDRQADDLIIGEQAWQDNTQQNFGLTFTHLFSSMTVGEFRFGLGLRNTNVNIAAGNNTPIVRFTGTPVTGSTIGNAGNFPIQRRQNDQQYVYNLSTMLGTRHFLRGGTDIRRQKLDDLADNNSRGSWTFTTSCAGTTYPTPYAAFLDGCVTTFTKSYGPFFLENRINEYNFYAQDDWQILPNLTLNLGLRYEYVAAPEEAKNRISYGYGADKYVEPRFGFAYTPNATGGFLGWLTGGPGNSALRGGYGHYHGRVFQSVFSQTGVSVRTNPPNALNQTISNSLNLADPTNGFVFVPGPQTVRHQEYLIDPNLKMPYTRQWNVTFERKLPFDSTMRLSYTGNHGVGLLQYEFTNLPVSPEQGGIVVVDHPNNAPAAGFPDLRGKRIDKVAADFRCAGTGFYNLAFTTACPVAVPIADNEISLRVPRTDLRRPDPRFTSNITTHNGAESDYNGVQLELAKTFSQGLQFLASYTYSKAIDEGSEATFVGAGDTNFLGPQRTFARGLSRFDTRHRFVFSGSYLLPIFRGRTDVLGKTLGGWTFSAVVKMASGTPFTVVDSQGGDLNFDGFSENRPVITDDSINHRTIDDPSTSLNDLPKSAFRRASPADPTTSLVGRNTFYGDGVKTIDVGLYKSFGLFGAASMSLRFEVFNLLNRTQFGFPTNDFNSATFGQIVGTATQYSPRTLQAAVRISI